MEHRATFPRSVSALQCDVQAGFRNSWLIILFAVRVEWLVFGKCLRHWLKRGLSPTNESGSSPTHAFTAPSFPKLCCLPCVTGTKVKVFLKGFLHNRQRSAPDNQRFFNTICNKRLPVTGPPWLCHFSLMCSRFTTLSFSRAGWLPYASLS